MIKGIVEALQMNFTGLTEQQIYGALGILAALATLLLVLMISWLAGADPVRKLLHRFQFLSLVLKTGALVGTWFLMQSDFYSVYTIFSSANALTKEEAKFLSYTFAAFLEGFAFLLGICLSKAIDTTSYRRSARIFDWIGVAVSSVALLASWGLSVAQRYNMLHLEYYVDGMGTTAFETFWMVMKLAKSEEVFMTVSPILTSVLAFGLSWLAFPSYSLEKQGRDVEYYLNRYLRFSKRYKKMLMAYQQKKARLWTALCGADEGTIFDMPADSNIYQSRCQQMIRQKTVNACVSAFSGEFGQYNKRIEAELSKYILELSGRSTLPDQICAITVEEVLKQYEDEVEEKALDCELWDSQKLRQEKKARLQRDLNNAACQAEFWFASNRKK